ncbi:MAG: class I SAM-dependent methyltransferase [Verrucomicrobia bacterium]|nr:class I SAM-dependent methyltransferase [Verrucomicrobiota bacterium]
MQTDSATVTEEETAHELQLAYELRFGPQQAYRSQVWKVLVFDFFQPLIGHDSVVLDLGCGWGEFINNVQAKKKYGMDLNPDAKKWVAADVELFEQDCAEEWPLPPDCLNWVFTSNFFEHLRGKDALRRTLFQTYRCLRRGGRLMCMGPNIRALGGAYWDFWDHYLPLTECSIAEALEIVGFRIERSVPRFLPYRMARRRPLPVILLRLYLRMPLAWKILGKQFLVIGIK